MCENICKATAAAATTAAIVRAPGNVILERKHYIAARVDTGSAEWGDGHFLSTDEGEDGLDL